MMIRKLALLGSVIVAGAGIMSFSPLPHGEDIPDRYETRIPPVDHLRSKFSAVTASLKNYDLCPDEISRLPDSGCKNGIPYELIGDPKALRPKSHNYPEVIFVPLNDIKKDKTLDDFLHRAGTLDPLECDQTQCRFVRYGFDPEHKDVKVILECSHLKLSLPGPGQAYSAPFCIPVMIEDKKNGTWALAIVGYYNYGEPPSGTKSGQSPDVGAFPVAIIGKLPNDAVIMNAVLDALVKPVLSLIPANVPVQNRVVAGVSGRSSPVVPPFREQTAVDVSIQRIDDSSDPYVGFWISFSLYVNRYNTDAPNDWHLPSEVQRDRYKAAIRQALFEKLKSACRNRPEPASGPFVLRCY